MIVRDSSGRRMISNFFFEAEVASFACAAVG